MHLLWHLHWIRQRFLAKHCLHLKVNVFYLTSSLISVTFPLSRYCNRCHVCTRGLCRFCWSVCSKNYNNASQLKHFAAMSDFVLLTYNWYFFPILFVRVSNHQHCSSCVSSCWSVILPPCNVLLLWYASVFLCTLYCWWVNWSVFSTKLTNY